MQRNAPSAAEEAFPSIWLRWHSHCIIRKRRSRNSTISTEFVPREPLLSTSAPNCGLYTRKLAQLSKRVYAFEPSHPMADLLRRTSRRTSAFTR